MTAFAMDLPGIDGVMLPAQHLRRLLGNALTCVSVDETVPVLGCIRLDVAQRELTASSTDRYCLVTETVDVDGDEEWTAIVGAEDVKLLRSALTSGLRTCEDKEQLTSVLHLADDRLHLAVSDVNLDVPVELDLTFPDYSHVIEQALDGDPAPFDPLINPQYLGRLGRIVGPEDSSKYIEPAKTHWRGGNKPLVFTWSDGALRFLLMPRTEVHDPVPDGEEGEVQPRMANLRDAAPDLSPGAAFLRHGVGLHLSTPAGVDPVTGEISDGAR
jgi:hypothetical protein